MQHAQVQAGVGVHACLPPLHAARSRSCLTQYSSSQRAAVLIRESMLVRGSLNENTKHRCCVSQTPMAWQRAPHWVAAARVRRPPGSPAASCRRPRRRHPASRAPPRWSTCANDISSQTLTAQSQAFGVSLWHAHVSKATHSTITHGAETCGEHAEHRRMFRADLMHRASD